MANDSAPPAAPKPGPATVEPNDQHGLRVPAPPTAEQASAAAPAPDLAPWAADLRDKLLELQGVKLQQREGVVEHKVRQLQVSIELGAKLAEVEAQGWADKQVVEQLSRLGARLDRVSLSRHRTLHALHQRHPLTGLPRFGYADALTLLRVQDDATRAALYDRLKAEPELRASRLSKAIVELRSLAPAEGEAPPVRARHLGTARRHLLTAAERLQDALQGAKDELQRASVEAAAGGQRARRWREEREALEQTLRETIQAASEALQGASEALPAPQN